jgi:plasmid maintenance system antidote protein VapI
LGEVLREAIRSSGRSLNQLGADSGVAPSQLSRFVTGKRGLTLDAADALCRVLGLKLVRERKGRG